MKIRTDDLLVLLAVSRQRTFTSAARELGVDHTTVARRMNALGKALGGPVLVDAGGGGWALTPLGEDACRAALGIEASVETLAPGVAGNSLLSGLVRVAAPETFTNEVVVPAITEVSRLHPGIHFELVSVTRPTPAHGPSADLDIGVTRSTSRRLVSRHLMDYRLGLFASPDYLARQGPIGSVDDLADHRPIYYVESMLQVDDLDLLDRFFPRRSTLIGATSVGAQLRLVRAGVGVGLLPTYLAGGDAGLVPVLPSRAIAPLSYWLAARPQNLARAEVKLVADALVRESAERGTD
ncbi:MAG: dmlR [Marmoricola sp.]|nr:dmlR [Marmoricola sp.]